MLQPFILNTFPDLLSFSLLGATVLRVVAGVIFIRYGYRGLRSKISLRSLLAWLELFSGSALVLGFYTQIAALILAVIILKKWFYSPKAKNISQQQSDIYALLLVVCLSLLLTGAGFFGLDLPL